MKRPTLLALAALSLAALLAPLGSSRQQPSGPDKASANAAYEAKDWAKAVPLYERITTGEPDNARAWYRLGISRHGLGLRKEAILAFQKAVENGVAAYLGEYQLAVCYAGLGEKEKALDLLEKATQHGFADPDQMRSSEDLAVLHGEARFEKALDAAARSQKPCAYAPESRQFDFWVGEWDVVTTQGGMPAGSSRIERTLGDCVILENWKSNGTFYEGKSYNTYNTALKRWEQFWVDNSQGMVHFYGSLLKNGVMDYYTDEVPQPGGTRLKRHLEFIPLGPDKVRQVSHGSTDHGKTWQPEYDFTYNRRK